MKKILLAGIMGVLLLASVGAVSASTVSLVQKDPSTWSQVNPDTFGTLTYSYLGSSFSFAAQGLSPNVKYSLISYAEDWPGAGSLLLGTGTADTNGDILITGTSLALVLNTYAHDAPGDYQDVTGAKIWLVPSSDFTEGTGLSWNPSAFLFETALINPTEIPIPEFPTVALPAALVIGLIGAVLFIQRSKGN